jgi:hypothetical protein
MTKAAQTGGQDLEQVDMRWGFIPGSHKGPISEFRIQNRKHMGRWCQSNGNSSPGGRNEPKPNRVYPMTDC